MKISWKNNINNSNTTQENAIIHADACENNFNGLNGQVNLNNQIESYHTIFI